MRVGDLFALSGLIFPIITGILYIIPYLLHGSSQCCRLLHSLAGAFLTFSCQLFKEICQGVDVICQGNCCFLPLIHVICITLQSGNLSTPAYSVAKRRQRLWQTISLLINATNDNKYIGKRHTVWSYFSIWQVAITNNTNTFWLGCWVIWQSSHFSLNT